MTIPGLALFYGGLVRAKNVLSVLMQVFMIFCLIALLWVIYGYSLAFTADQAAIAFIGGFDKALPAGRSTPSTRGRDLLQGVYIPELTFVIFQLTFAAITPALIVGAFAERMKFGAVLLFIGALVHLLLPADRAHGVVWADVGAADLGLPVQKGALDFAGGTVVHINAGVAGLVGA